MTITTEVVRISRTPTWGNKQDQTQAIITGIGATIAALTYTLAAHTFAPDFAPTTLEIIGTATSMACVWLTRKQNVLSMPYGIISVIFMGAFFFQIELVGQGWLHLGFYIPIQFIGWHIWIKGGIEKSDKPVSWFNNPQRLTILAVLIATTFILTQIFEQLHGPTTYATWDASIVAASIGAQLLLTWKYAESWWLWIVPINISAVGLYLLTDAYMFAALYAVYLIHAIIGLRDWTRAWEVQQQGATVAEARAATNNKHLPL